MAANFPDLNQLADGVGLAERELDDYELIVLVHPDDVEAMNEVKEPTSSGETLWGYQIIPYPPIERGTVIVKRINGTVRITPDGGAGSHVDEPLRILLPEKSAEVELRSASYLRFNAERAEATKSLPRWRPKAVSHSEASGE